jgi:hypothetical protein
MLTSVVPIAHDEPLGRAERELIQHPKDPRPASADGSVLIDLGETDRAREWIGRSLAIAPDDILTQYNAGCAYTAWAIRRPRWTYLSAHFAHRPRPAGENGSSTILISILSAVIRVSRKLSR